MVGSAKTKIEKTGKMSIASSPITKQSSLDGKTAWDACVKYGSIYQAAKHLINQNTERPYTKSGISRVAYGYALSHLAEVRPQWEQIARSEGIVPTEEAWKDWLRQKAHVVFYYRVREYEKFMRENGL